MKKNPIINQRQAGIIFITLGILITIFLAVYIYSKKTSIKGFPEILPYEKISAYAEFPVRLDENGYLTQQINKFFKVDWVKEISEFGEDKAGFALLKTPNQDKIFPILLIKIKSAEKAYDFLKKYKGLKPVFSSLLTDVLVISNDESGMRAFLNYQNNAMPRLGNNRDFIKLRQNLGQSWFFYVNTQQLPPNALTEISQFLPAAPLIPKSFPGFGFSFEKYNEIIQGKSYAFINKDILSKNEQSYKALILPYLPAESDVLISGQNLPMQIEKISSMFDKNDNLPDIKFLLNLVKEKYFGDVDFEKLFGSEFAFTMDDKKALAVTLVQNQNEFEQRVAALRSAFQKTNGGGITNKREVVLPDGTKAKELIPNPSRSKIYEETFFGIKINGVAGIFDAFSQNKWFVSNDLNTLKKALLLTKEPGINFRESPLYRSALQPILKNPELLGIAKTPIGTFGFSKRTFSSHMETDFTFVLK